MDLSPGEFQHLRDVIHQLCGLALTEEKEYLIRNRLEPVVRSAGCASFAEFLVTLAGPTGPSLRDPIIEAITTPETAFFRDGHPFESFRRYILPELAARLRRQRQARSFMPARIWCAAVATGQEAYSLDILIQDYLASEAGVDLRPRDFSILATDISARVLRIARAGRYSERETDRGLTLSQLQRHFQREAGWWVASASLRALIDFQRLNLIENFTRLRPVDVIFCRNVLIYFDEETRRRICEQFADILTDQGLLILGTVENLYGITTRFASEQLGNTTVYRKL